MLLRAPRLLLTTMSGVVAADGAVSGSSGSVASNSVRIAVIGGGVSTCSFIHELANLRRHGSDRTPFEIDVFDMGRGVGGRASTRRSRDLPSLAVNHGAPYFDVAESGSVAKMIGSLSTVPLEEWNASSIVTGRFSDALGTFTLTESGNADGASVRYFSGKPDIGAFAEALFAEGASFTKLRPSTQIRRIERVSVGAKGITHGSDDSGGIRGQSSGSDGGGGGTANGVAGQEDGSWRWRLSASPPKAKKAPSGAPTAEGKADASLVPLGDYDWLVVSGSTVAHPRWTQIFGGAPPLTEAAAKMPPLLDAAGLQSAVETISRLESSPVTAAMMAWHQSDECGASDASSTSPAAAAAAIKNLPFRVLHVDRGAAPSSPRSKLERVIVGGTEACPALVLHSTAEYSSSVAHVYGATSSAARVHGTGRSDAAAEARIVGELIDECRRVFVGAGWGAAAAALPPSSSAPSPPRSSSLWGPHLHRWGSAFSLGVPLQSDRAFLPGARVAFCGDFVAAGAGGGAGGGRSGAAEVTQSSPPDRGQDIAAGQPAQSSGATQASGAITPHSHDRTGGVEAAVLSGIETARRLYEVLLVQEAPSEE